MSLNGFGQRGTSMAWEQTEMPAKAQKTPRKKGKERGCLIVIAVIVAITAAALLVTRCASAPKGIDWPSSGLATQLPKPKSTKGEIHTNDEESLWIDIANFSESDFADYVEQCKEKGFTVDAKSGTTSYKAYSEDGHKLDLSFYSDEMSIRLDAPIKMGTLIWPMSGPGAIAPAPKSTKGKTATDSSSTYSAYIGDTSEEEYIAYVDACITAGFNVDYSRGNDGFNAKNTDGASINVSFEGFNTMKVTVYGPDDQTATEPAPAPSEPEPAEPEATPSTDAGGNGSSDFRAMADEYEAFMNQYVDFMKTYQNSDNTAAMLIDYTKMMKQYAEWTSKMGELDENTLSAEDAAYWVEVQGRVAQRLLEVQ